MTLVDTRNIPGISKKDVHYIAAYGISHDDYLALGDRQHWKCAICKELPVKKLEVDHCHRTGKVRGLLCGYCNKGLGHFKDSKARLLFAISYLNINEGNS